MILPTILNEDCLEALFKLDNNSFDICLIDPPYFDYKTSHRKDKQNKLSQSLKQQPRDAQLKVVELCMDKLKPGSSFWFFTNWQEAWWFQQRFYTHLRNEIIWDKGNWTAGDLKGSFGNKYEVIFLGHKGKGWEYKGPRIHDIWEIPRVGTNRIHSTEKPVELYRKIIEISTEPGAFVLDPYVGSGASAIAAMQLDRLYLGYELDETYHQRATERIKAYASGDYSYDVPPDYSEELPFN